MMVWKMYLLSYMPILGIYMLDFILVDRDPYTAMSLLLHSLKKKVVCHPLYTANCQGFGAPGYLILVGFHSR